MRTVHHRFGLISVDIDFHVLTIARVTLSRSQNLYNISLYLKLFGMKNVSQFQFADETSLDINIIVGKIESDIFYHIPINVINLDTFYITECHPMLRITTL